MSSSSSSSSSRSSSPEPTQKKALKRKRSQNVSKPVDSGDSESESSSSGSGSSDEDSDDDSGSEKEIDMDVDGGEPLLSHAERRRQKKRERKVEDESAVPSKKQKLKDGATTTTTLDAQPKRQNSVWVGNLSFKTTQENLRTFFKDAGEITRIHLPMKASSRPNLPKENRGFAYVDFATPEAKTAAIALSEQPLIGRKLLIKDGGDFTGRPIAPGAEVKTSDSLLAQKTHSKGAQKILRNQKQPPAPTLFVGNLPFETTDGDIRGLFEVHHRPAVKKPSKEEGEATNEEAGAPMEKDAQKPKLKEKDDFILKVRMGTFEDSGACKGFAFVDFSSIDNATAALINPKNHHFNGRDLKVEFAGADAVRRGAAKHLLPGNAGGGGGAKDGKNKKEGFVKRSSKPAGVGSGEGLGSSENRRRGWRDDEVTGGTQGGEEQAPGGGGSFKGRERGQREYKGGVKARPKPGAALALAKRETAAIIPSEGKKITF